MMKNATTKLVIVINENRFEVEGKNSKLIAKLASDFLEKSKADKNQANESTNGLMKCIVYLKTLFESFFYNPSDLM